MSRLDEMIAALRAKQGAVQPPAWSITAKSSRYNIPDVPCSRYDSGERNPRVIEAFQYALGMIDVLAQSHKLENDYKSIWRSIARLHDHKGWLFVVVREPPEDIVPFTLRRAWATAAGEDMDVQFTHCDSPEWLTIRSQFEFQTDWIPCGDDYYEILEKAACNRAKKKPRRYTLLRDGRAVLINGTFDEWLWEQAKATEVRHEVIDQPELVSDYIDAYGVDNDWIGPLRATMEMKDIPFVADWRDDYCDLFTS